VTRADLLAQLASHRMLGAAPDAEREWLAAHGLVRTLRTGEVLSHVGENVTAMHVYLRGAVAIRVDGGAGAHKIFGWTGGDVGGLLPYSRGARAPGNAVAEEPTEVLEVKSDCFSEMTRECPTITTRLVHAMLDRARAFNANDLRDEKLVSLGRLAAGLAHELNNPASAAVRSAGMLSEALTNAAEAATAIAGAGLSAAQLAAVNAVRDLSRLPVDEKWRSPVARADRVDTLADWLRAHGGDEDCAAPLADTAVTVAALDALAAAVQGDALVAALRWVSAGCLVRSLTAEIAMAASRIHDLVNSVKGFTYMDHAPTPEPVDIRRGITDTLTMLGSKVKARSATVDVAFADDLPRAHAVGAELNQVWMNILDNALDAIPAGGKVTVTAAPERDRVVVRVADNGPGIPEAIRGRIFDPFFTTKDVGKGTGLGLDIVRRILRRHDGEVDVESRPGHTEFQVTLPVAAAR
jgi:signal transduction histidine kinase